VKLLVHGEQNKMKKSLALLAATVVLGTSMPAVAQQVNVSAGAEVKTSYVFSDGFVVDPDPVLQAWGNVSLGDTTLGVWTNQGAVFDEVDLTLSQKLNEETTVSAARFLIEGDDITQVKVVWVKAGWDVAVSHSWWDSNPSGTALEIGRTWSQDGSSLRLGGYAETGFGFNPSLTASATASRTLGNGWSASLRAQHTFVPDERFGPDGRGTEVIFGIAKAF
jgi:hypothetical protein